MKGYSIRAALVLATGLFSFPLSGQAALIDGFGLADGPMLLTQSLLVAYDVDSGTLNIRGFDVAIDDGTGVQSVDGTGIVNSILSVDGTGLHSNGTFEIMGTIASMGFGSGVLISGEISDFGFPEVEGRGGSSDDILQFVIEITGGDAAGLFGNTLAFLVTGADFPGEWTSDWANNGNAAGVAASPIPLPAAFWFMFSALLALRARSRRG